MSLGAQLQLTGSQATTDEADCAFMISWSARPSELKRPD